MREGRSCLPCSGQGSHLRGGLSPGRERCPQHPPRRAGRGQPRPPGKEGSEGAPGGFPRRRRAASLQQALIAKGQLKANEAR